MNSNPPDFDRSYRRVRESEDRRHSDGGFGDTKQAHALTTQIGGSNPEGLARILIRELAGECRDCT